LIGLSYGAAQAVMAYGFLAVFAAGLALQRTNTPASAAPIDTPQDADAKEQIATDPERAGTYMTQAIRDFNQQLERIVEVAIVVVVGAMLVYIELSLTTIAYVAVLFLIVRPAAVAIGLARLDMPRDQRWLIGWFGIRGIGSVYYLMYAVGQGLPQPTAQLMVSIVLTAVAASIVLHGVSVTPLMNFYSARRSARRA